MTAIALDLRNILIHSVFAVIAAVFRLAPGRTVTHIMSAFHISLLSSNAPDRLS